MVLDKAKKIGTLLGLDMENILPYQKKDDGFYDAQEILRDLIKASSGVKRRYMSQEDWNDKPYRNFR